MTDKHTQLLLETLIQINVNPQVKGEGIITCTPYDEANVKHTVLGLAKSTGYAFVNNFTYWEFTKKVN